MGIKIDLDVLDKFSDQKSVNKFNKEVESFLDDKTKTVSREAIAFFYLSLHKIENEQKDSRRGLSLEEAHSVIRILQGRVLTLLEASITDKDQLKALKNVINMYFSNSQSEAQNYDWGRYDGTIEETSKVQGIAVSNSKEI